MIENSYLSKPFKNKKGLLPESAPVQKSQLLKNKNHSNLISDSYLSKLNKLNEKEKSIKELLNTFIRNNYYQDYLDFYITHFIKTKLDIDSIISKMQFNNHLTRNREIVEPFKENFKLLLRKLSNEELNKFNEFISGAIIEQNKYTFDLYDTLNLGGHEIPMKSHTCYTTLDINIRMFSKLYFNDENKKNNFVEAIRNSLINGFSSV